MADIIMHGKSFDEGNDAFEQQEVEEANVHAYLRAGWVKGPLPPDINESVTEPQAVADDEMRADGTPKETYTEAEAAAQAEKPKGRARAKSKKK